MYREEVIKDGFPTRMEMLDALYDSNRNYETKEFLQTYIVCYHQYNGKTYKYVSHATIQDPEALKRYIESQNGIDLYIDSKDPGNYYFDLPSA